MSTFAFKAVDLAGVPTRGEIEASDKQTVSSQLRAKGLIVIDIEEQAAASAGDILASFRRVKATDLTIGTRQLSTMVSSGMSLLRALYVIRSRRRTISSARPGRRCVATSRPASRSRTRWP